MKQYTISTISNRLLSHVLSQTQVPRAKYQELSLSVLRPECALTGVVSSVVCSPLSVERRKMLYPPIAYLYILILSINKRQTTQNTHTI